MSIQLLDEALCAGVLLYLEEGRLKARGATEVLTEQFRQRIAASKSELTVLLEKLQTRTVTEQTLRDHEAYWLQQLSGAPPLHGLPLRAGRGERTPVVDRYHTVELERELTDALLTAAQEHGRPVFTWLHAALCVVIARWSGEDDLVIGTRLSAGLAGPDADESYAYNTVALRTDVAGDPSFVELLKRCDDVARQAQAHAIVPFGWVVRALGANIPSHASPLFQISLHLDEQKNERPALSLSRAAWPASDLQVSAVPLGDRWQVRHRYSCSPNQL